MKVSTTYGTADQSEANLAWTIEAHRLDGGRPEAAADRRVVRGQHQVLAAFEDAHLVLHGPRRAIGIRFGEDVEDLLGRSIDVDRQRPELTQPAPHTEVDRNGSSHQTQVEPATSHRAAYRHRRRLCNPRIV